LNDYVKAVYEKAGFDANAIVFADDRLYHGQQGSFHCATNVVRETPEEKWWEV
jgi:hypothetical protein